MLAAPVSCAPVHSPEAAHAPLLGGEITLVMHCLERSREFMLPWITPFEVEACSGDSLQGEEVSPTPVPIHVSPECNNRLVHITTEDHRLAEVLKLADDGSFRFRTYVGVYFKGRGPDRAAPCVTWFNVELDGVIRCRDSVTPGSEGAEIHSIWEEAPELMQAGCPTTLPCRFKTATDFRCT